MIRWLEWLLSPSRCYEVVLWKNGEVQVKSIDKPAPILRWVCKEQYTGIVWNPNTEKEALDIVTKELTLRSDDVIKRTVYDSDGKEVSCDTYKS